MNYDNQHPFKKMKMKMDYNRIDYNLSQAKSILTHIKTVSEYKKLLLEHGWNKCSQLFHPDMNSKDKLAFEKYTLLKEIYQNMKMDGEL